MVNEKYYFIGIGGIGMSALAGYLNIRGCEVAGYDLTPSAITQGLIEKGISITFNSDRESIVEGFEGLDVKVIYTPAIPSTHQQLQYFCEHGNSVLKRASLLGEITQWIPTVAVAGTHGKTTVSSILTHLLLQSEVKLTAFLGGVLKDYNTNFFYTGNDVAVVEADEYDRSFLKLEPTIGCITSMDADHLDIYGTKETMDENFQKFADQIKETTIVAHGLAVEGLTYGIDSSADYRAINYVQTDTGYRFDFQTPSRQYFGIDFHQLGIHNLNNLLCALAVIDQLKLDMNRALEAVATFKGIIRRINVKKIESRVYIDDYAHHPKEIKSILDTVRSYYSQKKSCVIFQPHLFTRTRDFMDEFAEVLSDFDQVILLPIYPARELPIDGVTSEVLCDKITNSDKRVVSKEDIPEIIDSSTSEIFLFLGAGDIGVEAERILNQ